MRGRVQIGGPGWGKSFGTLGRLCKVREGEIRLENWMGKTLWGKR